MADGTCFRVQALSPEQIPGPESSIGAAGGQDRRASLRLILILGALSAFGPLSLDLYLPALPALAHDLDATAAQAQLTITSCLVGLAAGQLVAGSLSDSRGRRRPLMIGLVAYTATSLLCALAPSIGVFIFIRLLQGAAGAAGIVISRAVARDLFSGFALARFYALLMLVNGLAPILAPVLGGQLLRFGSWRLGFVALTVLGMALVAVGGLGLKETLPVARRRAGGLKESLAVFRNLLTDASFVGWAVASGLAIGAMFVYIAASPFVLETVYGVSPQGFSLLFALNALGIVAAGQASARLVQRLGQLRLLVLGLAGGLAGGLGLLLAVLAGAGLVAVVSALFLVVATVGLVLPNATALALSNQGRVAGSASALLGLVQFAIGAVVAPLAGAAGIRPALTMALLIVALRLGAVFALLIAVRRRPQPVQEPAN